MKMNEMYVAPELEVLEVMVEQGFAATGDNVNDPSWPSPDVDDFN